MIYGAGNTDISALGPVRSDASRGVVLANGSGLARSISVDCSALDRSFDTDGVSLVASSSDGRDFKMVGHRFAVSTRGTCDALDGRVPNSVYKGVAA